MSQCGERSQRTVRRQVPFSVSYACYAKIKASVMIYEPISNMAIFSRVLKRVSKHDI